MVLECILMETHTKIWRRESQTETLEIKEVTNISNEFTFEWKIRPFETTSAVHLGVYSFLRGAKRLRGSG